MIDARAELKAYLDGELNSQAAAEVEAALAADPALAREAAQYRAIAAALARERSPEPVGLESTLTALRRRSRQPARRWWLGPYVALPLGLAALAIFVLNYVVNQGSPRSFAKSVAFASRSDVGGAPVAAMAAEQAAASPTASMKKSAVRDSLGSRDSRPADGETFVGGKSAAAKSMGTLPSLGRPPLLPPAGGAPAPQSNGLSLSILDATVAVKDRSAAEAKRAELTRNPNVVAVGTLQKLPSGDLFTLLTTKKGKAMNVYVTLLPRGLKAVPFRSVPRGQDTIAVTFKLARRSP